MKKFREGPEFSPQPGTRPSCVRRGRARCPSRTSVPAYVCFRLLFQGNGVLCNLVKSGDDASIGFVAALRDDEVGEFGGDIDVGSFERTAGDAAESAAGGRADGGLTGGDGGREIVVAVAGEALF